MRLLLLPLAALALAVPAQAQRASPAARAVVLDCREDIADRREDRRDRRHGPARCS